jgi:hypothetical protein
MKVSIITEDNMMLVDGEGFEFNLDLPSNVWSIQWNGSTGEVEFNDGTPNQLLTDFTPYQYLIGKHSEEKQRLIDVAIQESSDRVAKYTYVEKRSLAYPSIVDQLDDIYHNGVDGWKISIKAVKDQFPKS